MGETIKRKIMNQEEIWYKEVIDLGFQEEYYSDSVHENQYGFQASHVMIELSLGITCYWEKEDRTCYIIRCAENGDIKAKVLIRDLEHLKEWVLFFKSNKL